MKARFFSLGAVILALVGVSNNVATSASRSRISGWFHFKPAMAAQPTAATLTNAANWETVPNGDKTCAGNAVICLAIPPPNANITTVTDLVSAIRSNGGAVPSGYAIVLKPYHTI